MQEKLDELKSYLLRASDLRSAAALLYWDQATYMPPGGAEARGRQLATLSQLAQEKFTDPAIGRLLDELRPYEESLPYEHDDASLIRVARREYERATKLPPEFVAEISNHMAAILSGLDRGAAGQRFRRVCNPAGKNAGAEPPYAEYYPGYAHIADPLIDEADYGMTVASLRPLFAELRRAAGAVGRGDHRHGRARRLIPAPALPGAAAAGLWRWRWSSATATIYARPAGQDPSSLHDQVLRRRRAHHHALSTRTTWATACSPPSTSRATRCTSKASTRPSRARRWAGAPPPASTRASRGCGRTWWAAAGPSGAISSPNCRPYSRSS